MGVCNCSMFCCTLLYVHFSIAIILMGKRELIALLNLSSWCLVLVERLFLTVPRGCLQFVIVVFPDHTHLLFLYLKFVSCLCPLSFDLKCSMISTRPCQWWSLNWFEYLMNPILSWRLIMKWFLRSFSPFRWFIQEGLLSVTSESMCTNYWLTACSSLSRKKCC